MQITVNRRLKHRVTNCTERIQLLTIIQCLHILHLYAPQTQKADDIKFNFRADVKRILNTEIHDDLPILLVGDFNVDKNKVNQSYLKSLLSSGKYIHTNKPTQKYGGELDYGYFFNKNNPNVILDEKAQLFQLATSDHDAICFDIIRKKQNCHNSTEKSFEKTNPRTKIPLPRSFKEVQLYQKLVKNKWGKFLEENSKIKSFLNSSLEYLCLCKKGNDRRLLNIIYDKMREIICESANSAINKRNSKKRKKRKYSGRKFKDLYQKLKDGEISKGLFKKSLKELQKSENVKLKNRLIKTQKDSKSFFQIIKTTLSENKPKSSNHAVPYSKIASAYKQIYEPENFSISELQDLKHRYQKIIPKNEKFEPFQLWEIQEAFKTINKKKASRGPVIELWMLANFDNAILKFLNKCSQHGYWPQSFLTAEIVLLKKDNCKADSDHTNYRPISLIESLSKVAELLIKNRIPWEISAAQYAYQPGVGTINCLKDYTFKNNSLLQENGMVISTFFDMSKAFDKLSLKSLMKKMEQLLADDKNTLRSLSAMLLGTKSIINQEYEIFPRSGIRQGSLLSPFLFIQACNDWVESVNQEKQCGNIYVYADDITLQSSDPVWLQQKLDEFSEFCFSNSLLANPTKCCSIINTSPKYYQKFWDKTKLPKLSLNNTSLKYVSQFKLLGYTLNSLGDDSNHLPIILSKMRCRALTIRRYFKKLNNPLRLKLIQSYVTSALYGLELSRPNERFRKKFQSRFLYTMSIIFKTKTALVEKKLEKFPKIQPMTFYQNARKRFEALDIRNR